MTNKATIVISGLVGNDHAAYDGFAASPMATFPRAVSRVVSLLASSRVSHAFMGRPLTDAKRPFAQSTSKSRRDSGSLRSNVNKARVVRKIQGVSANCVAGQCLCGDVRFEIDFPARWAWHDHSSASRRAHGAAYATYVGSWRSRFRVIEGLSAITRFEDKVAGTVRSFCALCGTPLFYERARSPHMVNIPRALFQNRTGREPRYHIGIEELQEWAYTGEPLAPLKGFPGVVWERRTRKKRLENALF